jgi:hypothetical protein
MPTEQSGRFWPLAKALCWVAWRDPAANPVQRIGRSYCPYPWERLAALDAPTAHVHIPSLGEDVRMIIRTDRGDLRSENSAFFILALKCASGLVTARGRDIAGPIWSIPSEEWWGPVGLSDRWCEVWLNEADMLREFPRSKPSEKQKTVKEMSFEYFKDHQDELIGLPTFRDVCREIAATLGLKPDSVERELRPLIPEDVKAKIGRKVVIPLERRKSSSARKSAR